MSEQQMICKSAKKYGCVQGECSHAVPHDANSACNKRCMAKGQSSSACVPFDPPSEQIHDLRCRIHGREHAIRELTALELTMRAKNDEDKTLLRRLVADNTEDTP